MDKKRKKRLGDLLVENNMITQTQLEEALKAQTIYGGKLGTNLVELGYISEASLTKFLSAQLSIPAAKPEDFTDIPEAVLALISRDFAVKHKMIPLKTEGKRLLVATSDPYDIKAFDELGFKTSKIIDPCIAPEILIVYALENYYGVTREARYIKLAGVTAEEMRITDNLAEEINTAFIDKERPRAHPYPLEKLCQDLAKTDQKEEIFNILFKYFEFYFQKLAIFVTRHNSLHGFVVQGFQIAKENFRKIEVPVTDHDSIFKQVYDTQTMFYGDIKPGPIHDMVKSALVIKDDSKAYLIPLVLNNQTISVLFCYKFKEIPTDDIPFKDFDIVAKKISYAFQIMFLKKRIISNN
jgi:hypothetical protein